MVQCPSCARIQEPRIVCLECQAPLASNVDYFAAFELPRKLTVEANQLEEAYHRLGRMVHPDRFATKPAKVRDASQRVAALLTKAYRTLRDPVARGNYWLELHGYKLGGNNQQVPADLVELVFDTQEELAELKGNPGDKAAFERLSGRREEVREKLDLLGTELAQNFAEFDAIEDDKPAELFEKLKINLSRTAYLRTLLKNLDSALDSRPTV